MIDKEQLNRLLDSKATVLDSEGHKIGTVGELYLDDRTQDPSWASVKTGLFGMSESFVPLDEATADGDDIHVPYTKDQVKDAPRIDPDGHLEPADEERLHSHYGLSGHGDTGTERSADTADRDTEGNNSSSHDTDDAMIRSEERLHLGTETQEVGRARLRKYVVTENETRTVPVSREEVRIEREPLTDGTRDDAPTDANLREEEHDVTLHAERPVVEEETVPVERVRLDTETVTEQETVNEEISREENTPDTDASPRKH